MKRLRVFSLCGCYVTYGGECVTQNYVHLWIVRVEPLSDTRFAHCVRGIVPRCEFFSGLDMFESCALPPNRIVPYRRTRLGRLLPRVASS